MAYHRPVPQSLAPAGPVAILSFHSHGDRSFLDDQILALASGDLRRAGIENDVVLSVLDPRRDESVEDDTERRLLATLERYSIIVFERVWSRELVARLRDRLPGRLFVSCRGEHVLDDAPADWLCHGDPRRTLPPLIAYLQGRAPHPPVEVEVREGDGFRRPTDSAAAPQGELVFEPNLRPVVVNPEDLPKFRTFSVTGNKGCPYQADARENPVYQGSVIPLAFGRGCAFCTTGNNYEAAPGSKTAASVLEQIRYVRTHAPELDHLVLKDQNPFAYLSETVDACADEGLTGFTLMLETRADWFMRSTRRFEQTLQRAESAGIRIAPFLVGVENFSQPELERFNKGTAAEANITFLEALWDWQERFPRSLTLEHASFGFILFTPWTTLDDLRTNLAAVRRTKFDRFRGSILHSRVRLYPDTALYYLAKRDDLLSEEFQSIEADNSKRYGYFPANPWRFRHPEVAHFAELAAAATTRTGSRDQVRLFQCLLDAFDAQPEWQQITLEDVLARYDQGASRPGVPPELRARLARLIRPLPIDGTFAGGWRLGDLTIASGKLRLSLSCEGEPPLVLDLDTRTDGPSFARSRHYAIRHANESLNPSQTLAATTFARALMHNDR